ncbi:hypothetical protein ASG43_03965 [Aureimonas sp. Leaf454]|nr:hypothetical protein ASG43_03965 [Aureimonas sp. Leaf454]
MAVLGASGLIGEALCNFLLSQDYEVVPVARRFTPVQTDAWRGRWMRYSLVDADTASLSAFLAGTKADVVVNCVGALQDAPGASASNANRDFVERLVEALQTSEERSPLLIHISIPGLPEDDRTEFSLGKRAAEAAIRRSALSYVILHPGFVVAQAAFGGSALMRSLAVVPFDLPDEVAERPFAVTDARDIGRTVAFLLDQSTTGRSTWQASWDMMEDEPRTVGEVLARLSARLAGPRRRVELPHWMLITAGVAGDAVSRLGWRPPVRSTALSEMRRGVTGDATSWRAATGLVPLSGPATLDTIAATVQERWFARLYLLKAFIFGILVTFWIVSGGIAVSVAFDAAVEILTDRGFARSPAEIVTVATSLMDIAIGVLIANRRTCRIGLLAGIGLSIVYMLGAALITPGLWIDPLGALVKTGPAIVLMMVGLAVIEDR